MQNDIPELKQRVEDLESKVSDLEADIGAARSKALHVGSLAFRLAKLFGKPDAAELQSVLSELEEYG